MAEDHNAIKQREQALRGQHHRTNSVGDLLRKVVQGHSRTVRVPCNTVSYASSCVVCADVTERLSSLQSARACGMGPPQLTARPVERWLKQTGPLKKVKLRGLPKVDWMFRLLLCRLQSAPNSETTAATCLTRCRW